MSAVAPPWLGNVDDLSETERHASMTPEERLACFTCSARRLVSRSSGPFDLEAVLEVLA